MRVAYFRTDEGKKRGPVIGAYLLLFLLLFQAAAYTENRELRRTGLFSVEEKNSDGSFTREFHINRINYRADDGSFREIKKNVDTEADGSFSSTENDIKSFFPKSHGSSGIVYERKGNTLAWELKAVSILNVDGTHSAVLAKNGVRGKAKRGAVSYGGVFENIDDMYSVAPGKVKNNLIINSLSKGAKVFISGVETTGETETEEGFEIRLLNGGSFEIERAYT